MHTRKNIAKETVPILQNIIFNTEKTGEANNVAKNNTRKYERKAVNLETMIISATNSYIGFIKNISEYGANAETASAKTVEDFTPGTILRIEFRIPSVGAVKCPCEVAWLYTKRNLPYGLTNKIGLEIYYPPLKFAEFIKTLQ